MNKIATPVIAYDEEQQYYVKRVKVFEFCDKENFCRKYLLKISVLQILTKTEYLLMMKTLYHILSQKRKQYDIKYVEKR